MKRAGRPNENIDEEFRNEDGTERIPKNRIHLVDCFLVKSSNSKDGIILEFRPSRGQGRPYHAVVMTWKAAFQISQDIARLIRDDLLEHEDIQ
ncbi:MAG: hypothetical protein OXI87_19800 [Albidovulum sp.]|nr:hypothetical protein [Albidovulum sp.]